MAASSGGVSAHELSSHAWPEARTTQENFKAAWAEEEEAREMAASSGGVSAPGESSHAGPEARSQEKAAWAEMKRLDTLLVEQGLRGFFHEYAHRMVGRRRSVTQRGRLHNSVGQG